MMDAQPRKSQQHDPFKIANETIAIMVIVSLLVFLASRSIILALVVFLALFILTYLIHIGWLGQSVLQGSRWMGERLHQWRIRRAVAGLPDDDSRFRRYDIFFGIDLLTGKEIVVPLRSLYHIGLWAATGFGKTTWLHAFIHQLIRRHRPSELLLTISDPKGGTDFGIYGRLPHLYRAIAKTQEETGWLIEDLQAICDERATMFAPYARTHVCNDIDRYYEITGVRLPRVVAIFDELDKVVKAGSQIEENLIDLAKRGRVYGIHLVCATQRPSSRVFNGELKTQLITRIVGYMTSATEYANRADVPADVYRHMKAVPGRFMLYTAATQWLHFHHTLVPDDELREEAGRRSVGRYRTWADVQRRSEATARPVPPAGTQQQEVEIVETPAEKPKWGGSTEKKQIRFLHWLMGLDKKPQWKDAADHFGISPPTAGKYINDLWDESRNQRSVGR